MRYRLTKCNAIYFIQHILDNENSIDKTIINSFYSMKRILLLFFVVNMCLSIKAQMVLEFNTKLSPGTTITLPLYGTVDINVDWGDGTNSSIKTEGDFDRTYAIDTIYTVSITGTLTHFGSNNYNGYANSDKLVRVISFGNLGLTDLYGAFNGASNLIDVPDDIPAGVTNISNMFSSATLFNDSIGNWNVSNVNKMEGTFHGATSFNQDIGSWDVSGVRNFNAMFYGATSFNQDIGDWDISNAFIVSAMFKNAVTFNQDIGDWDLSGVTYIESMFQGAKSFNQDIGNWNLENVIDISFMFKDDSSFNQDIGRWNVGKVIRMKNVFENATSFNQDIGDWDVSNVTDMYKMFLNATSFNQDLSNWDINNVTNLSYMFCGATSFNQDLSKWDVSNVTDMYLLFCNIELTTAYYNNMLISWIKDTLQENVSLTANFCKYSPGEAENARQYLIDSLGWTILDAGLTLQPALITKDLNDLNFTSVKTGGYISNDGGDSVLNRGIVCDTVPDPTYFDYYKKTNDGSDTGSFISSLSGLIPYKTYYVRAYATNGAGTSYGNRIKFLTQNTVTVGGNIYVQDKVYDNSKLTSIDSMNIYLVGVDIMYPDISISEITVGFQNASAGKNKEVCMVSVDLVGKDAPKYILSLYNSPIDSADIITKELNVVGAIADNKIYDGNTNTSISGANLIGVIAGDDITINNLVGIFNSKNVGTGKYVTSEISFKGDDSSNYHLIQPKDLIADITKKDLTFSNANATNKVYNGTSETSISIDSLIGIVTNDDIMPDMLHGYFVDKYVGNGKSVIANISLKGIDTLNYHLIQPTELTADIYAKEIVLSGSFTVHDKEFDGNKTATIDSINIILTGVIQNDDVKISNIISAFSQSKVGTNIPVNITNVDISGSDASNYSVSFTGAPATTANIYEKTGVNNLISNKISVYPNPFTDIIHFNNHLNISKITISNIFGDVIFKEDHIKEGNLSLKNLNDGIYLLEIQLINGDIQISKIIKY